MKTALSGLVLLITFVSCKKESTVVSSDKSIAVDVTHNALFLQNGVVMYQTDQSKPYWGEIYQDKEGIGTAKYADTSLYALRIPMNYGVGNSYINGWGLQSAFYGYNMLNRAFGGSRWSQMLPFMQDLFYSRTNANSFILYEATNEINDGKHSDYIFREAKLVIDGIRKHMPLVRLILPGYIPNPQQWKRDSIGVNYNRLLKSYARTLPNTYFLDIHNKYLPLNAAWYTSDGLHLSIKNGAPGYVVLQQAIRPYLIK